MFVYRGRTDVAIFRGFTNASMLIERHQTLQLSKFHVIETSAKSCLVNVESKKFNCVQRASSLYFLLENMISPDELEALRRINSPTIANAIETFNVRPRGEGVSDTRIQCLFPEFGVLLGYACTATILSGKPAPAKRRVSRTDYWDYTKQFPGPKITVIQDLSEVPGGAYWGEVNASIHLALGSRGVVTNGSARDLDEVRATGFHLFSSGVSVSHGFAHLEDFQLPVTVFGMTVRPGDLVHADPHGAVVIPREIAAKVAGAAHEIERAERKMLNLCRSRSFSIAKLDKLISPEY
jgi:4-hydroxy-4-methyl-2-oxoglutarate aldolase